MPRNPVRETERADGGAVGFNIKILRASAAVAAAATADGPPITGEALKVVSTHVGPS